MDILYSRKKQENNEVSDINLYSKDIVKLMTMSWNKHETSPTSLFSFFS